MREIAHQAVNFLRGIQPPSFGGLTLYNLMDIYITGILKGALAYRASAISFSFFMAIFPSLLFVLNLIPYVPIENFQEEFQSFLQSFMPHQAAVFFDPIFEDMTNNRRGELLSSVFILSIFLMANGINAIFGGFETSYHVEINRSMVKQYLVATGVALIIAFLLLITVAVLIYFEIYILRHFNLYGYIKDQESGVLIGKSVFLIMIIYLVIAILYYFGTTEGRQNRFFSPGALLTTLLIIITTYLFGVYLENFSNYNEIYGSIAALLILMLYIWINSNILLLGFELNAAINRIKKRKQ